MIPASHDFNLPLEVTEINRVVEGVGQEDEDGNINVIAVAKEHKDYSSRLAILWDDVICLKEFNYVDDYKIKGPKCFLCTEYRDILILGDYEHMLDYWTEFRRRKGNGMA